MSAAAQRSAQESRVSIWLTPALDTNYRTRAAFPGLRADSKEGKKNGPQTMFFVSVEFAREVLADARDMLKDGATTPGQRKSYSTLAKHLARR